MPRYIDAEKLKDEIRKEFPALGDRIDINTIINSQPTADVAEVWHGEWYRPREWTTKTYRRLCTNCQDVAYYCGAGDYKFCPNCGARMDVERRDDGEIY